MTKAKDEEAQVKIMSSEIDLNVLIKFIGTFDGSRDTLIPFLNNCRNAINLASSTQQDTLFKYILTRLSGKAESVCAIKEFSKWSQLEDFLKTQFGDKKHYAHLLADLQGCRQHQSEEVGQYSLRIESCLSKLLTEINISIPTKKKDELSGRIATMQDLALNRFMMGLDPRLATVVRCRDPATLNEAINFAIAEEKILGITYKGNSTLSAVQPNMAQRPNFNSFSRPQGPTTLNNRLVRPQGQSYTQAPICRYCKNIGHTIENCRKRQYNNNRRAQNADANFKSGGNSTNSNFRRAIHNISHDNAETACHECSRRENNGYDTVDTNLNE